MHHFHFTLISSKLYIITFFLKKIILVGLKLILIFMLYFFKNIFNIFDLNNFKYRNFLFIFFFFLKKKN